MSNDNVYLPGKIRDRIQDLIKSNKVTQTGVRPPNCINLQEGVEQRQQKGGNLQNKKESDIGRERTARQDPEAATEQQTIIILVIFTLLLIRAERNSRIN